LIEGFIDLSLHFDGLVIAAELPVNSRSYQIRRSNDRKLQSRVKIRSRIGIGPDRYSPPIYQRFWRGSFEAKDRQKITKK